LNIEAPSLMSRGVCFCYTSSIVFLPPWGLQNVIQNFWKIYYACCLHLFVIAEESVLKFVPFVAEDLSVNVTGYQFV